MLLLLEIQEEEEEEEALSMHDASTTPAGAANG